MRRISKPKRRRQTDPQRRLPAMAFAVLALVAPIGLGHASAKSRPAPKSEIDKCFGQASNDTEVADCTGQQLDQENAALNATYKALTAELDDNEKAKLVQAERSWIAFRDTECAFSASGEEGGTDWPVVLAACQLSLTSQRVKDLKGYLNSEEFKPIGK